jgi:lipopolysaccharide export system permease protein
LSRFITATDRYIFRLVIVPMLSVFVLAASLLMLEKMLRLMEFVSTEGGPVHVVFRMLFNLMPEYASLAIPLGLMLGILFAFRKLATSSELDVMRAVGLSYTRLLRVPYLITGVLVAVNLVIVGYLQPLALYDYQQLNYQLRSGALGAAIKVGEFTALEDRVALRVEESEDEGRKLMGIFARIADKKGQVLSISAREGRFMANRENRNTIILRLTDCRSTSPPSSASASAGTRRASTCCRSCSSSAGANRFRGTSGPRASRCSTTRSSRC